MDRARIPQRWICLGKSQLIKHMFQPVINVPYFLKPHGGLWISPYTPQKQYKSPWHEWCSNESFQFFTEGVILTLPNGLKVYTIDSQRDLINLVNEIGTNKESDWFTFWKIPNFEKASEIYDAIYLTEKGQIETRLPWSKPEYSLYGWDVESMLLLRWRIKSQKPIKLNPVKNSTQYLSLVE